MGFPQKKKVDGTIPFFTYNNQINYKFIKLKPLKQSMKYEIIWIQNFT